MNLDEQIKEVLAELHRIELAQNHITRLNKRLAVGKRKLISLEEELNLLYEKIKGLEKQSMKKTFYKLLGNFEKKIELEQEAYLKTFLAAEETSKSIELMEFEKNILEEKLHRQDELRKLLNDLLLVRTRNLNGLEEGLRNQIIRMNSEMEGLVRLNQEVKGAKEAGVLLHRTITEMIRNLQFIVNEENWSTFNLSNLQKNKLQLSKDLFWKAKQELQKFEDELSQINKGKRFKVLENDTGFKVFSTLFFDNLFPDWTAKLTIYGAIKIIEDLRERVRSILAKLDNKISSLERRIKEIEGEKRRMLLDYYERL